MIDQATEIEERCLVYVPNHPAIQAAAAGLAEAAGIEGENAGRYLPIALAELLGASRFRPDEGGDHLVADWPQHWFTEWQYLRDDCELGLRVGWRPEPALD